CQFLISTEEPLEVNHPKSVVLDPVIMGVRSVGGQKMAPHRCAQMVQCQCHVLV
ncbi:hypothetical protein Tco_0447598, partial [Tanacetum coccineum]